VRELQNVIERAVITATNGLLNLDGALPAPASSSKPLLDSSTSPIRTARELEDLERANILRALEAAHWKVSGDSGAASLLGMNPSTLSSRMKTLGIHKPR
jgi:transcriptional regulator with GAF, ATPase, and Fis domain